jgi:predicted aldo/keto reductase-like oxidoreductase
MKTTAAGAAGALIAGSIHADTKEAKEVQKGTKKTLYRTLGKTGIKVPVISMGVMNADNPSLIRAALDSGITFFDTAYLYQRGKNEEMVGEMVKGRPRDSFVVATKVPGTIPIPYDTGLFPDDEVIRGRLGDDFLKRVDISLKRLQMDHVDILYLHNVWKREAVLSEPLMKALEKAKKDGKTRFIGVSTHRSEPEVIRAAIESKLYDVVLTAYNFKQQHHSEIRKAIAEAAKAGLGVVAMKNIAVDYSEKDEKKVDPKTCLKWALQDENVHTTIPGFTTFEQLNEDLSVMEDISLTDGEKKMFAYAHSAGDLYCQGCESCLKQCVKRLPIPELMRAYMYAYGYRNLSEAETLLSSLRMPRDACNSCAGCTVKCAKGFPVSQRIRYLMKEFA